MLNDGNWQSSSITNLDIADGIVACKFNKPCEAHTYDIILNTNTISLSIPYSQ
jgi:hypothetical protein